MKKTYLKQKLIFSGISLFLVISLLVGMVFAWYSITKTPSTGNWKAGVMTDVSDKYKDIFEIENPQDNEKNTLNPGGYLKYSITLKNNTGYIEKYKLAFDSVVVSYPVFDRDIDFTKFICDLYEFEEEDKKSVYEPLKDMADSSQAVLNDTAIDILEAIATPVSNAVSFYYGLEEKEYSDLIDSDGNIRDLIDENENIIGKAMKSFGDLQLEQNDPNFMKFVGTTNKTICKKIALYDYPKAETLEPEWIEVQAGEEVTVYFSLYFDGKITTSGLHGDKRLIMENSNGFLCQNLKIIFSLDEI